MTAPAHPRLRVDLPSELVVVAARDEALVEVDSVAPELVAWHRELLSADVELVAVRVGAAPLSLVVATAVLPAGPDDVVLQGLRRLATGHVELLDLPAGRAVASARVAATADGPAALAQVLLPLGAVLVVLTTSAPDPSALAECAELVAAVATRVSAE